MNIITYADSLSQAGFEISHTHSLLVYKGLGLSTCGHPFPKPMLNKRNTRGSPQKILNPAFAGATLKFQTLESSRGKRANRRAKEAWRPHQVLIPKPTWIEQDRPLPDPPAAFKGMRICRGTKMLSRYEEEIPSHFKSWFCFNQVNSS